MILWQSVGDGLALARRIHLDGFPIRVFLANAFGRKKCQYSGLVPMLRSFEEGLALRPAAIIFDSSGSGPLADALRRYVPVWGAGSLQDALEFDRRFGLETMVRCGIRIPQTLAFDPTDGEDPHAALRADGAYHRIRGGVREAQQIVQTLGGRWVVKLLDSDVSASTFVADDPEQMVEHLAHEVETGRIKPESGFILQRVIDGIELSTEAWFQHGQVVPGSINGTIETKKAFTGDRGPQTGSQSSTVWAYAEPPRIFYETIGRPEFLAWARAPVGSNGETMMPFHGPLDINCLISNDDHLPYAVEWTPRGGYSASYAFAELLAGPGGLHEAFANAAAGTLPHLDLRPGFGYCLQLTIPPFPVSTMLNARRDFDVLHEALMAEIGTGVDIQGPTESSHVWLLDARVSDDGNLQTAGVDGIVANVSAYGMTIEAASAQADALWAALEVDDKQGRTDGAERAKHDTLTLAEWGYETA